MVETGLNGLHKLHAIIILFICHGLLGKSGLICINENILTANAIVNDQRTPMSTVELISEHFIPLTNEQTSLRNSILSEYLLMKSFFSEISEQSAVEKILPLKKNSMLRLYRNFYEGWMDADEGTQNVTKTKLSVWPDIYPFEKPTDMRDRYLDLLILGEKEYNAMGKGKTVLGTVPVTVEYIKKNGKYSSLDWITKSLHEKTILSLKPLDRELSLKNSLCKSKVHYADKEKILFSYGIRDAHPEDGIMVIEMFYSPEPQADSAR